MGSIAYCSIVMNIEVERLSSCHFCYECGISGFLLPDNLAMLCLQCAQSVEHQPVQWHCRCLQLSGMLNDSTAKALMALIACLCR